MGRVEDFINRDPKQFSWDDAQRQWVQKGRRIDYQNDAVRVAVYRPFTKQWTYFHRMYNARVYQLPSIFPHADSENRVICVSGIGAKTASCLMVNTLPDLEIVSKSQCFPRYTYFQNHDGVYERHSNVNESVVRSFKEAYPEKADDIDADIVFHYVYGLLHSLDYRDRFGTNLLKQLPRIPLVANADDFAAFAEAGRLLGDLHVNFDGVEPWPALVNGKCFNRRELTDVNLRVEKMRFAGKGGSDRSTVIYNHRITVSEIPKATYDYVVNGKSPVQWVMERQGVTTHQASGIVNDANQYANETVGDPLYPLKLLLCAIRVGMETSRIIGQLPFLELQST